jgi:hypothetical protein
MDQKSIQTPNPECRLYWCFILVFSTPLVNWRPSNLLTGASTPPPPPSPCVNKYRGTCVAGFTLWVHVFIPYSVLQGGGRGQIGGGPQTDEQLPPSTFSGQFLRKADIFRVGCLLVHAFYISSFFSSQILLRQ